MPKFVWAGEATVGKLRVKSETIDLSYKYFIFKTFYACL
jgi:hypothetical protein